MNLETGCYSDPVASDMFVVGIATSVKAGCTVNFHWKSTAPDSSLRDMWNGHEHGILAQAGYVQFYRSSLDKKREQLCKEFARILAQAAEAGATRISLRCYEPNMSNALPASATFCHRYSLKHWLSLNFKAWLAEQAALKEVRPTEAEVAALVDEVIADAPKKRGRKAVTA
jgi:hypothetical protein